KVIRGRAWPRLAPFATLAPGLDGVLRDFARCAIASIVSANPERDHVLLHFSRTHEERRRRRLPLPSTGNSDADTPDQQTPFAARICRRRLDCSARRSATGGRRNRARAAAADLIDKSSPL